MIALVREVSPCLADCELTFLPRVPINAERAYHQHTAYAAELGALGLSVEWLPPLATQADGVFVEDTAVVLPEVAVITRPGAASRRDTDFATHRPADPHQTSRARAGRFRLRRAWA